ncbi:Ig-like domain-containing protein [Anaerocolumna sp. AGMB13020]|uniref:Ig-like domain-containing protein n=1 Tax=Anaerocolumna sp. AGMB13020 TaxID=3081750 RepID=UPI0029542BFD|nr:Ig-like domain-containing protein [Anaerocolumna sp. AGMB13020]WOO38005.1 Ig-like domain-containing protein [Anaerocolumna sp. AGMB13020]
MKKYLSLFLLAILLVSLLPIRAEAAKVKYVLKADVVYELYPKEKITLYVNTKSKTTWSSSNKKIATVSSKGIVTAKKPGNTIITATVGKKKYKCKVQVWSREPVIISEHDISPQDPVDRYAASEYVLPEEDKDSYNRDIDGIKVPDSYDDESDEYGDDPEWVGDQYLNSKYGLSASRFGDKIYLIRGADDSFEITASLKGEIKAGVVYECKYNNYTIRIKYVDELLLLNTDDLKNASIIK